MSFKNKRRLFACYLSYVEAHLESGIEVLKLKVFPHFADFDIHLVVINNRETKNIEINFDSRHVCISGDNSSREFSGYDKGVKWLQLTYNIELDDIVLFCNDTFHRSYGIDYLSSLTSDKISKCSQGHILGYIDAFPRPVWAFDLVFQSWIRTSFFAMPYLFLQKILPFTLTYAKTEVFGDSTKEFFRSSAPLSEEYKVFLTHWLFENSTPAPEDFKQEWHSKIELTELSLRPLQEKAWCILCEQNLSARAQGLAIPVCSMNNADHMWLLK